MSDYTAFSAQWLPRVESALAACMIQAARELTIGKAGEYALMGPGKRIRPLLTLMAADACGADPETAMPAAMAVEMVHAFSLAHDDLPCMDNDDLRRGRPTTHKVFGEAMGLLAGDALLASAFQKLCLLPPKITAACVQELSFATVMMVEGQAMDITESPDRDRLNGLKTGALIVAALRMGAIVAGAEEKQIEALTAYGRSLGLLFQITDDLLDGEAEEGARKRANDLSLEAAATVKAFGVRAQHLRDLAAYLPTRDR
ncbi:MAG: polyprenyl synthetase family protein [Candidatus Peribacteraceae bacterium]|nr:polyprenyl synthetase family protein [Candidatus Peribacteraceae bacterium]